MNLRIELNSRQGIKIYEFDYIQNLLLVNGKAVEKDISRLYADIMELIKTWPKELKNLEIVDGLSLKISYREKGKEIIHNFINKFPENFDELSLILEEVENAVE